MDVLAIIEIESKFDPRASNPDGLTHGLMQIHVLHKVKSPFNYLVNIKKGVQLLQEYSENRSINCAVLSYNAGPVKRKEGCKSPYTKKFELSKQQLLRAMSST